MKACLLWSRASRRRAANIAGGLIALMMLVICGCKQATPAAADADRAPESVQSTQAAVATIIDSSHPRLQIATLDHGLFDLAKHRGRWVVVNFWATWCSPCLKEMPELEAFDRSRDDVDVIGLAYEEITPEDLRAFLKERPVSYPVAIIDTFDPPADFGTPRGLPMTYLIAPDGNVAKTFMGPMTTEELTSLIDSAGSRANATALGDRERG